MPDASTIISATLKLSYSGVDGNDLGSPDLHIASATQASVSALSTADYDQIGRTSYSSISFGTYTASTGYKDFAFNASGLAAISKTGYTKLSTQTDWDINDSEPTWISDKYTRAYCYNSEQAGTGDDPKLVINYTVGGAKKPIVPPMIIFE